MITTAAPPPSGTRFAAGLAVGDGPTVGEGVGAIEEAGVAKPRELGVVVGVGSAVLVALGDGPAVGLGEGFGEAVGGWVGFPKTVKIKPASTRTARRCHRNCPGSAPVT